MGLLKELVSIYYIILYYIIAIQALLPSPVTKATGDIKDY